MMASGETRSSGKLATLTVPPGIGAPTASGADGSNVFLSDRDDSPPARTWPSRSVRTLTPQELSASPSGLAEVD